MSNKAGQAKPLDVVVVAGVSGGGKSTVASGLAKALGWVFLEGDDFHSESNKEKMHAGKPLNDDDRWPWLAALRAAACEQVADGKKVVLACSALRQSYRQFLRDPCAQVPPGGGGGVSPAFSPALNIGYVLLDPPLAHLKPRLEGRKGHFMPYELLHSQLTTLERGDPCDWLCIIHTMDDLATSPHTCSSHTAAQGNGEGIPGHAVPTLENALSKEPGTPGCLEDALSKDPAVDQGVDPYPSADEIIKHVVDVVKAQSKDADVQG